jgi:hypothetical protein
MRKMVNTRVSPPLGLHDESPWCFEIGCDPFREEAKLEVAQSTSEQK